MEDNNNQFYSYEEVSENGNTFEDDINKFKEEYKERDFVLGDIPVEGEIIDDEEIIAEADIIEDDEDLPSNEDVLQLTEYIPGDKPGYASSTGVSASTGYAEYTPINITYTEEKHQKTAKNLVEKIVKFIKGFKDVALTPDQQKYIDEVGELQLSHLSDLLTLTDINKQILHNMVARINMVQAEDYAMIATYNNLVTQHLKLLKELHGTYKNIPSVIKKMRTEIICDQQLLETSNSEVESLSSDYGESHFNNQKTLLKDIREKIENQTKEKQNSQ